MSFLDDAKKKLDDVVDEHGDKIADGVEKAGDFIDEKTGHKHADKVDQAQEKIGDAVKKMQADGK
ncbi:MAG: antitoxin [Candidatus Microthrix subdominans]